jgi:hypothetical protein
MILQPGAWRLDAAQQWQLHLAVTGTRVPMQWSENPVQRSKAVTRSRAGGGRKYQHRPRPPACLSGGCRAVWGMGGIPAGVRLWQGSMHLGRWWELATPAGRGLASVLWHGVQAGSDA